jgi:tetratricopeptide (TPR) repeat protein
MSHASIPRAFAAGAILLFAAAAHAATTGPVAAGSAPAGLAATGPIKVKTTVRSGNHPGFGRVVIDTNDAHPYELDRIGDHAVVRFDPDVILTGTPTLPSNVVSIEIDGSALTLTFRHGSEVRSSRIGGLVALDIMDPKRDSDPPPRAQPTSGLLSAPPLTMASSPELGGRSARRSPGSPPANVPAAVERVPVEAQTLPPPADTTAPRPPETVAPAIMAPEIAAPAIVAIEPTRQIPPGRDIAPENEGPVGLIARRVKLPKEIDGTAFLVPFDTTTGAASFRGRDSIYIVFDERRPVDLAALKDDPVFAAASVQLLPNGTLLRVPVPASLSVALTQLPRGWRIAALATTPKQQPIATSFVDGRLNLAAEQSGDVVSLADPDTGATLLVGTQHRPGQGVATGRRSTEFILRPTLQGVVVEPLSDAIALKQVPAGFSLTGNPDGLALSPPSSTTEGLMDAVGLTRRLDFATMQPEALLQRATRQLRETAAAPQLARGVKHHAAAESLIALGLAAEAGSLLRLAAEQDPREAASPDTGALTAIAALLAGRTAEADALLDPRLDGTDEIALWRAVRLAMLDEGSPNAAAVFASTAPLAVQYPPPIRDRILPLIAETMIQGGELNPAARLLGQRKTDPKLAYARALMKQAEGDTDQALNMLDALANGHDQFDRARAAIRAVELRLATRGLDKTGAADALDKLLYAWRGDARELALRERVAALRSETGAWPAAAATLRQAETDFPEQKTRLHDRLKDTFAGMIRDREGQHISPIEFVSLVDENLELMPNAGDDQDLEQSLADRLLRLDLPGRAKPVLEKLVKSASSAVAKARFGASLATLDAREGNDAGARTALDGSEGRDLPPDLVEQRTILRAASVARLGDPAAAAAMLVPLHTGPATEARAQILENASDWAAAARAWAECAALTLPKSGMLDETQAKTILRLATATARANDDAGLAELRLNFGDRIGTGPLPDMFRLLTAEPIRTTADVGRSKQEISLAASLPSDLKAIKAAR